MPSKNVHTEHCCKKHGCKYGDEACPVASGLQEQSYDCEACHWEDEQRQAWAPSHEPEIHRPEGPQTRSDFLIRVKTAEKREDISPDVQSLIQDLHKGWDEAYVTAMTLQHCQTPVLAQIGHLLHALLTLDTDKQKKLTAEFMGNTNEHDV